jgi:hypothetical protein
MSIKKEDVKIIKIDLNRYDRLEDNYVFLKNIERVSKKINLDKNILIFYIINGGNIENIINGFKISKGIKNIYTIEISKDFSFKEVSLKEDVLYNFANYCTTKGFSSYTHFEFEEKEVINSHNNIFDKEIKIELDKDFYEDNETIAKMFFEYEKEKDFIPDQLSLDLLKDEDEHEYHKLNKYLDNLLFDDFEDYNSYSFDIKFTNCLDTNIKLIDKDIHKNYELFIENIKVIKKT